MNFYQRVGDLVLGRDATLDDAKTLTLPLPRSNFRNDEWLCSIVVNELERRRRDVDVLLIDLANPPSHNLPYFSILQSLATALRAVWWRNKKHRALILLPRAISPNDTILQLLGHHLDRGQLALIEPNGSVYGKLPTDEMVLTDYSEALKTAREEPLELIKRRMIRRIGYFRRSRGISSKPTKYFYDGRLCIDDIIRIINSEINFNDFDQILFHSPVSSWLADVASALAVRHGISVFDLSPFMNGKHSAKQLKLRPLVLVPLVDSGETIHLINETLKRLKPKMSARYVAIMSTRRQTALLDEQPLLKSRKVAVGNDSYNIEYILPVEQIHYSRTPLPESLRHHRGTPYELELEPLQLTSYAFWSMVADVGWKLEDDVPSPRVSLGSVPRFPEIVQRNAPLIAYKLDRLLREGGRGLPVDPLLVRPEEQGARRVAECLVSMYRYTAISVPRTDIDDKRLLVDGKPSQALKRRSWWQRLRSAYPAGTRVILLDEFRVGGGTLTRLAAICEAAGLAVESALVLADFGSSEDTIMGIPVTSLYQIPLLESAR